MDFAIGDVVVLRGGGPFMTVTKLAPDTVTCQWWCHPEEVFKEATFLRKIIAVRFPAPGAGE